MTTGRINQVAALHLRPPPVRGATCRAFPGAACIVCGEVQAFSEEKCCDASGEPRPRSPEAAAADQTHACVEAHSWLLPGLSVNDPKDTELRLDI